MIILSCGFSHVVFRIAYVRNHRIGRLHVCQISYGHSRHTVCFCPENRHRRPPNPIQAAAFLVAVLELAENWCCCWTVSVCFDWSCMQMEMAWTFCQHCELYHFVAAGHCLFHCRQLKPALAIQPMKVATRAQQHWTQPDSMSRILTKMQQTLLIIDPLLAYLSFWFRTTALNTKLFHFSK